MYDSNSGFKYDNMIKKAESLGIETESFGKSWQFTEISCFRIGSGFKKIIIVGGFAADESFISQILADYVFEFKNSVFTANEYNLANLEKRCTFYVIPLLNPDGLSIRTKGPDTASPFYDRLLKINKNNTDFSGWKSNMRGVSLNKNFNAAWAEVKMQERRRGIFGPSIDFYGGEYPESELETASLCSLTRKIKPAGIFEVVSGRNGIIWGFNDKKIENCEQTALFVKRYSSFELLEEQNPCGGYRHWAADKLDIPAFTLQTDGKNIKKIFEILNIASAVL